MFTDTYFHFFSLHSAVPGPTSAPLPHLLDPARPTESLVPPLQQLDRECEVGDERADLEHHRLDDEHGQGLENARRRRRLPVIPRRGLLLLI